MSNDKHNCGCGDNCGCGHDHEHEHEEEFEIMTLTLDDGQEIECAVIGVFPVEESEYIALIPIDDLDSEDGEVFLYRYEEYEDGGIELLTIESDEEYDNVAKAFDQLMDEEFDDEEESDEE